MKKTIKLIFITLISITLIFSVPFYSNAAKESVIQGDDSLGGGTNNEEGEDTPDEEPDEKPTGSTPSNLGGLIGSANDFLDAGTGGITTSSLDGIFNFISGVLLSIATGITTISAVIMGINFTIQSVEDKAKIKESMVPWVIGIIISFGAYGIWRITMGVFMNMGL